jgi:hypothetical protein
LPSLKGQSPEVFHLSVFVKQLLPVSRGIPKTNFEYFSHFIEIFDLSGYLPVSTTLAKQKEL